MPPNELGTETRSGAAKRPRKGGLRGRGTCAVPHGNDVLPLWHLATWDNCVFEFGFSRRSAGASGASVRVGAAPHFLPPLPHGVFTMPTRTEFRGPCTCGRLAGPERVRGRRVASVMEQEGCDAREATLCL